MMAGGAETGGRERGRGRGVLETGDGGPEPGVRLPPPHLGPGRGSGSHYFHIN